MNERGDINIVVLILALLLPITFLYSVDMTAYVSKTNMLKSAINRGIEAATMQVDPDSLATGNPLDYKIDPVLARQAFDKLFQLNAFLNNDFTPQSSSFLKTKPEILSFYVYDGGYGYPYTYYDSVTKNTVTFRYPSVYVAVKADIQGLFSTRTVIINRVSSAELLSKY
ncbi:hypothetical protein [Caldanaerobacter subterraneus]|uniref:Uncharacterized protein n=1 Tax=Caldanaerobacter subterraneus TaxID=911092 RepID=A0A7Y2PM84_9THEO|nr:hypothetical protein [Caldanaerobacter subterraneus]NNG66386.1 hypothetical protein [Caldanaerobacter subterraneus]